MHDENQKPDYSFIMNQPGFEPAPKKRSKKPLGIIGGAVMFLMVIVSIAVVVGNRSTDVKQLSIGTNESQTLLINVASNNVDSSFDAFQTQASLDKEWFTENFLKPYNERFDMGNCVHQTAKYTVTDSEARLTYHCPFRDKSQGDYVVLLIGVDPSTSKITKLNMVTSS